jgi:hypothetical protein
MSQTPPEPRTAARPAGGRKIVLALTALGLAVCILATARLAAVVAATPPERWLAQDTRLIDLSVRVSPSTEVLAEQLSRLIGDPSLLRGRLARCSGEQGQPVVPPAEREACLAAIDDALRAAPSSSELWLFRATTLARSSDFGDALLAALRNSYTTGPREGWVASGRVVLALRLWFFLPPDLQDSARGDLALVLANNLAEPLARSYVADPAMRRAALPALQSLPSDLMDRFVWATRDAIQARTVRS